MLKGFFAVLLALLVMTAASQSSAAIPYRPITPFDVPNSTIQSELAPAEQERAKILFAKYKSQPTLTSGSPISALLNMPSTPNAHEELKTTNGRQIDAKATYLFMNAIEKALNAQDKTLRSLTSVNLDTLPALSTPQEAFPARVPSVGLVTSPPSVAPAPPPVDCPVAPATVNFEKAWKQISDILDGTKVQRCDLDFAQQLATAEALAAVVPPEVSLPAVEFGAADDHNIAQAYIKNALAFDASKSLLTFTSTMQGAFMGHPLPLGSIVASVSSPKEGGSTASIDVLLGNTSAYSTSGSWNDLKFNLKPNQSVRLFEPWQASFQFAPLVSASFEVNSTATYGINGHIQTHKTAAYLDFHPDVTIDITGGLKVSAIVVSGGLDGKLTLIDSSGDFGGVAAVFNDSTSTGAAPTVAVAGPVATYNISALKGSLQAYAKVAFFGTKITKTIKTWDGTTLVSTSLPTSWTVYRLQ